MAGARVFDGAGCGPTNLAAFVPAHRRPAGAAPLHTVLPRALNRFCVDHTTSLGPPEDPLEADHVAVAPSGFVEEMAAHDAGVWLQEVGQVRLATTASSPVTLAILDTSPTQGSVVQRDSGPRVFGSFDGDTTSIHGVGLASLAGAALCGADGPQDGAGGTNCAASIRTELALPQTSVIETADGALELTADVDKGGNFGTITDLANAVLAATVAYVDTNHSARGLVLNISSGFDPRWAHPTDDPGTWGNDAILLHDVLLTARCNGALILAAEGNADRPAEGNDVLIPAAWGELGSGQPEPSEALCDGYLLAGVTTPAWDGTGPLVHAVGANNAAGGWAMNTLPVSTATLRAFGERATAVVPAFAVSGAGTIDRWATPLTGSSAATLVVSAAAAARWAAGPDACDTASHPLPDGVAALESADTVIAHLAAGGCTEAGEVTMTAAVGACGDGPICAEAPAPEPPAAPEVPEAERELACASVSEATPVCASLDIDVASTSTCGEEEALPADFEWFDCPEYELYSGSEHPWVLPQPGPPYCPMCVWDLSTKTLFLDDAPVIGASTSPANLILTVNGDHVYGAFTISANNEVIHIPTAVNGAQSARLTVFNPGGQNTCPVGVVP